MMPPLYGSRHSFTHGVQGAEGVTHLTDREPYGFQKHSDNRVHLVSQGDTLWGLAGRYFQPLPRACGYWWVIADYQRPPIVDPTIALEPGEKLFIPSVRVLTDVILAEPRRRSG